MAVIKSIYNLTIKVLLLYVQNVKLLQINTNYIKCKFCNALFCPVRCVVSTNLTFMQSA